MIELLSPAGSFESLQAAIRCGADAVYFGLPDFNARKNAQNFTKEEFKSAVNYCHIRGVKTFITLNTLVSDDEINKIQDSVKFIAQCGADAVIVQDLGVADLIKNTCPGLDLHASTQMSVHSASALYKLKEYGFKRVVLARELNQNEIKKIVKLAKQLNIETEVFVHGAHCMCVSGQCYMSGIIGQRSGNRGLCAQPCRMEYENKHPLSLKDMSLIKYVDELENIGITSMKIEGRMKRPEYIACATKAYYNAVNKISDKQTEENLNKVFSRSGHTDGYFTDNLGADMFGFRSKEDVINSACVLNQIHDLYRNELQRVKVYIKLKIKKDLPVALELSDGENVINISGDKPQTAISKAIGYENAKSCFEKLGGTPYLLENFTADIDKNLFVSVKQLNLIKRQAVEMIAEKRNAKPKEYKEVKITDFEKKSPENKLFLRFGNINQIPADLYDADRIYIPLSDKIPQVSCDVGVEIPRVLFEGEDAIFDKLLKAKSSGAKYALCHNIAAVVLAQKAGLKVHLGFGMNIFNSLSANKFDKEVDITLSFELQLKQAQKINRGGIIIYGRLPLMITRNCIKGGSRDCKNCNHKLSDRKGYEFPVLCNNYYCELLNSKPLYLSDINKISDFDFKEMYFTTESEDEVENILKNYRQNSKLKGDFTNGLYFRGVL